jgi:phosphate transport system protein
VSVARRVIYLVTGEYDQTVDHEEEEDAQEVAALEHGATATP